MPERVSKRIVRSEARLEDRYVLAGMLIVVCIVTFAFAGDGKVGAHVRGRAAEHDP